MASRQRDATAWQSIQRILANAAVVRLRDGGGEICKVSPRMLGHFKRMLLGASRQRYLVDMDSDLAFQQVERNGVTVLDQADGTADGSFGSTMNPDGPMGNSRHTGIGNEGDSAIEFGHGEYGGGDKYLRHATGDGSEISQDYDRAWLDALLLHRRDDVIGIVKADGGAFEVGFGHA